jgi:CMP-N-acetylneuraminic acid synthetase
MLYGDNLNPLNHNPEELVRTQDLPPVYEDNSNLYIFPKKTIKQVGARIGESPLIYEMDEIESIDIDIMTDFKMAEYFHNSGDYGVDSQEED